MSAFLTKLEVEQVDDSDKDEEGRGDWRLTQPLVYQSDWLKETLTVPVGFVTDFASVPRIPLVFDWLGDRGNLAATLHDWLYTAPHPVADRATADRLLLEALVAQGVGRLQALSLYVGVRVGGESHWG